MRKGSAPADVPWREVELHEVAHIQQGKTLAVKDMAGGAHPVFGANGIIGHHDHGHYEHPVVALGCRGTCGSVTLAPAGAYLANNVMAIWPQSEDVLVEMLALAIETADLRGTGVITGQVQPQITRQALAPLRIRVPPLNEQRRIVEVMEAVDGFLRSIDALAGSLERLARPLFADALRRTHIRTATVGDLVHGIEGGRSPRAINRVPEPGEAGVLKVSAVKPGRYLQQEAKVLPADTPMPESARVRSGDVLITRANTRELVGAVCRVPASDEARYLCDKTLRLHPETDLVDPDYLVHALNTGGVRQQIEVLATGSTASMKNISQESIRSIRIPLPSIDAQRDIAGALSLVQVERTSLGQVATRATLLRGALLQQLLKSDVVIAG